MYFWKIERLKADLKTGVLPQNEQFGYVLAHTVLWSVGSIQYLNNNWYDVLSGFTIMAVVILGTIYVYGSNSGRNGDRFLERFISIGWVLGIRFLVIVFIPAMILFFIVYGLIFHVPDETGIVEVIFMTVLVGLYYLWFGYHVRQVAANAA